MSAEIGLAKNVAALSREGPLQAEAAFRDMVFGVARSVLANAFEALDGHRPSLVAEGRTHRRAEVAPGLRDDDFLCLRPLLKIVDCLKCSFCLFLTIGKTKCAHSRQPA